MAKVSAIKIGLNQIKSVHIVHTSNSLCVVYSHLLQNSKNVFTVIANGVTKPAAKELILENVKTVTCRNSNHGR